MSRKRKHRKHRHIKVAEPYDQERGIRYLPPSDDYYARKRCYPDDYRPLPKTHFARPKAWKKAHPERYVQPAAQPAPARSLLLEVSNEYFTAAALWKRIHGVWSCTQAAPIIHWMVGLNTGQAKIELLRRGCRWQWITPHQEPTLKQPEVPEFPTANGKVDFVAQSKYSLAEPVPGVTSLSRATRDEVKQTYEKVA